MEIQFYWMNNQFQEDQSQPNIKMVHESTRIKYFGLYAKYKLG